MTDNYEMLNLEPEASLQDVKASYRHLARRFHPDASNEGDPGRFREIHNAYRSIINELALGNPFEENSKETAEVKEPADKEWRFEGVADKGENIVYIIRIKSDSYSQGLSIVLPYNTENACPRCMGAGHTLAPIFGGPHLRRRHCPRCEGKGFVQKESNLRLELSSEMIDMGRLRLKSMGHYNPVTGKRGDLGLIIKTAPKRETENLRLLSA